MFSNFIVTFLFFFSNFVIFSLFIVLLFLNNSKNRKDHIPTIVKPRTTIPVIETIKEAIKSTPITNGTEEVVSELNLMVISPFMRTFFFVYLSSSSSFSEDL